MSKTFKEELRDIIVEHTSKMLDNPDTLGIYPTTRFYNDLESAIKALIKKHQPEKLIKPS